MLAVDATLLAHQDHWLVREIVHFIKRTLKRLDLTVAQLLRADRAGQLLCRHACSSWRSPPIAPTCSTIPTAEHHRAVGDERRPVADEQRPDAAARRGSSATPERRRPSCSSEAGAVRPPAALDAGLVTFAPDELDWDDEVRLAIEARAALSPDALTGMEANLRFAGPETMETKIFGRLTAWQNWIFQRPNAVGEKGALTVLRVAGAGRSSISEANVDAIAHNSRSDT